MNDNLELVKDALRDLTASNITDVDLDYIRFLLDGVPAEDYPGFDYDRIEELREKLNLEPETIEDRSATVMNNSAKKLAESLTDIKSRREFTSNDLAAALGTDVETIEALETGEQMSMSDWQSYAMAVGAHIDIRISTLEEFGKRYPHLPQGKNFPRLS